MQANHILTLIIVGLIIGALGRLVVPGRNKVGIVLTIAVGIVSAIAGALVGTSITDSALLITVVQVAVAAVIFIGIRGRKHA